MLSLVLPTHTQAQQRQPLSVDCFVAPNRLPRATQQGKSDIDLHQSPSQEVPQSTHPVANFRQHQSSIQLASQVAYPEGDICRQQTLLRQILPHVFSTCTAAHILCLQLIPCTPCLGLCMRVNPMHKWANSNQHSVTTGRRTIPTQGHSWSTQLR